MSFLNKTQSRVVVLVFFQQRAFLTALPQAAHARTVEAEVSIMSVEDPFFVVKG